MSEKAGEEQASLEQVASEVVRLFDAGMSSIFQYGPDIGIKHIAGFGIPSHSIRKLEEAQNQDQLASLLGESARPLVIADAKGNPLEPVIGTWTTILNAETIIIAPLNSKGALLGWIAIYHTSRRDYGQEECNVLQTLAVLTSTLVARVSYHDEEKSESPKSQLFSVLSHELRTPLTSIMGFTQLIRKRLSAKGDADHRTIEQLDILWAQAQRLNRLIDTFVDMSRIERGEFEITRGQVELTGLLRLAAEQSVAQASSHHTVNVDAPPEPLWLHGDTRRLEQMFGHLLANALRYSPQDQPIEVSCNTDTGKESVSVRISDHGPGIPPERLKDAFDRNYPSGPLKSGGLGVGLYLSKVIVEAHGGKISVESAPGVGTTVDILLPV